MAQLDWITGRTHDAVMELVTSFMESRHPDSEWGGNISPSEGDRLFALAMEANAHAAEAHDTWSACTQAMHRGISQGFNKPMQRLVDDYQREAPVTAITEAGRKAA